MGGYRYETCGLSLRSDQELPWLVPARTADSVDVEIRVGVLPGHLRLEQLTKRPADWVSCQQDVTGTPWLRIWQEPARGLFVLLWSDRTVFVVHPEGNQVWVAWPSGLSAYTVLSTYFAGNVLSFLLRLRGYFCLHASAAVVGERALIFAGPPGAGKSTLAAAMALRGGLALADDLVAIRATDGILHAWGVHRQLHLWPAAVERLLGARARLPRLWQGEDKRCLKAGSRGLRFARGPVPVGAVYLLSRREPPLRRPRLESLAGAAAVAALLGHCYGVQPPTAAARELDMAIRLAGYGVRKVIRPEGFSHLEELLTLVEQDARALLPPDGWAATVPANACLASAR